jgi:hypothetical protein
MENLNRQITFAAGLKQAYLDRLDPKGDEKLNNAIADGRVKYDEFMALVENKDEAALSTFKDKYSNDSESAFEDIIENQIKADISYRKN